MNALVPTVFHEAWWLEATTGGDFHEITAEIGGRVVGRLPLARRRLCGVPVLFTLPSYTDFLGPAIDEGSGASCNRLNRRMQITQLLLDKVPKSFGFYQKMHGGVTDVLPFQNHRYDVSVQFTFEIAPAPEAILWRNMRDKTRNVIRRAQESLQVVELSDPDLFMHEFTRNLDDRNVRSRHRHDSFRRVFESARSHDQGRMIAAYDTSGSLAASLFYIWDARTSYYLLTTRSRQAGNGAVSLLLWNAIAGSAAAGRVFDFSGVGTSGSIMFYSGFGGRVAPRYIASRYVFPYRAARRVLAPRQKRQFY